MKKLIIFLIIALSVSAVFIGYFSIIPKEQNSFCYQASYEWPNKCILRLSDIEQSIKIDTMLARYPNKKVIKFESNGDIIILERLGGDAVRVTDKYGSYTFTEFDME